MLNTTLDDHLDSGNIATRVRAKNEKARKNTVHKKSQHFNARNLGNTSSLKATNLSYIYIYVNDNHRYIRHRLSHFHRYKIFI